MGRCDIIYRFINLVSAEKLRTSGNFIIHVYGCNKFYVVLYVYISYMTKNEILTPDEIINKTINKKIIFLN